MQPVRHATRASGADADLSRHMQTDELTSGDSQPHDPSGLQHAISIVWRHGRSVLHWMALQGAGGPLSGGGSTHAPPVHTRPLLEQLWQACPPCPHVSEEDPEAHMVAEAQQPLQVAGPHPGAGPASLASTTTSSPTSAASTWPPPVYPDQSRMREHAAMGSTDSTSTPLPTRPGKSLVIGWNRSRTARPRSD